jgi:hypothetical protein
MSHPETDERALTPLTMPLTAIDVDDAAARRIRERAHAALAAGGGRRRLGAAGRAVEAAIVVGIAASYLVWAIGTVFATYR